MPTKRVQQANTSNNLYLQAQPTFGTKSSPSLPAISRSTSPSGLSNFFSRPTKWFARSNSAPRPPLPEPRSSTSSTSTQRRPTISGPTDPRPIPAASQADRPTDIGNEAVNLTSRSVVDLSLGRVSTDAKASLDPFPEGLGDLHAISRKPWSKSADNLNMSHPPHKLKPLDTSLIHEQKFRIEQYRAGNSPSTPLSSPASTFKHYPFPSAVPSTPKKSELSDLSSDGQYAHVRSRSHTPNPNPNTRLGLPSPQQHILRKKSSDSEASRDKLPNPVTPIRGTFLFPFGGAALNTKASTVPSTVVLPVVIEPEPEPPLEESKRASQIVHRSAFVARLQDFSPASPQLSASKKWKPFKLVLQGSKLYFYKPPSDRSAAIKELFPSNLVAVIEQAVEESEEEATADETATPKEDTNSRRKRAFWGRRRHPDLTVNDDKVEKGQWEALVHEAIFGTTFRNEDESTFSLVNNDDWRQYASAILLCLPHLVDRTKVDTEFMRCASYLVNGAAESDQDTERSRVLWLTTEYVAFHGIPVVVEGWETFKREIVPSFSEASPLQINSLPTQTFDEGLSPNLETFSPRPMDSEKLPTFASLVPLSPSQSAQSPISPARSDRRGIRARTLDLLDQEGLSRDVFLRLDVDSIVASLLAHHRGLLDKDPSIPFSKALFGNPTDSPLTEFFGCNEFPHWLTRLIIIHVLGPGVTASSREDDRTAQTSRTHIRSDVIGRWARVGEICRQMGDECSWRAIMAALCSKPIARLEKAWKRVDSQAAATVRAWVYPSSTGGKVTIEGRRTTPWGSDSRQQVCSLLSQASDAKAAGWQVKPMEEVKRVYDEVRVPFLSCARSPNLFDADSEEEVARLQKLWDESSKKPLPKSPHLDQYMPLSCTAEPRGKGRFTAHYWTRPAGFQGLQTLLPLAFPEPLPTITLIDRSQIIRSKKVSNEIGAVVTDVHTSRIAEFKSFSEPSKNILNLDGAQRRSMHGLDLGGTVLPVFDGDLLLRVQPNAETAIGTQSPEDSDEALSRAPSIRVRPGGAALDRKASRIRRSSMPTLSKKPSIIGTDRSSEPPLRVVVQAGTLDQLVSLLAQGLNGVTVSVTDDNGEMALHAMKTRNVRVDRAEFATIWWNVFRSFVSPLVLFELLRKLYLNKLSNRASMTTMEVIQGIRYRMDVIETMSDWIQKGGGAQDALDDLDLHTSLSTFLSSNDDSSYTSAIEQNDELKASLQVLDKARESLFEAFTVQTMRPQLRLMPVRGSVEGSAGPNFGTQSPLIDSITPEDLVNNLDAMAGAAFRNIVQEDLYVASDLLEIQTADRVAWFLSQEPFSSTDEVEIQTLYTHLIQIEPTSLIGESTSDNLYRLLPPGIRSLIRAYTILRKWAICQLVAPQIGLRTRQMRMELFLQAIEVCRLKSIDTPTQDRSVAEQACLRSFVEAVLSSAVMSPESRLFQRAWMNVATSRNSSLDSLASLLSRPVVQTTKSKDRLTIDPAWLLERMLEIISLPDILDSPSQSPTSLVNYDKRRHLYNLISNASSLTASRSCYHRRELDRTDFERLNNIDGEVSRFNSDLRTLKDEAQREALAVSPVSTPNSKRIRPFQRLVLAQQEKIKRDRYLRDRLLKEKRQEQLRHERREDDINRAMDARKATYAAQKQQHRSKKSMSAFFRVMRPISTAFSGESGPAQKRTLAELDFKPTSKPNLVLSLVDAHVASYINNERSFTFQVDTEDGGHYLIQAMSRPELNKWLAAITNSINSYAQRRLTYMGEAPKPQLSDHMHSRPKTSSQDPKAVFGVDLEFLLRREAGVADIAPGAVPWVIDLCLKEIESRGLAEPGIYRVAGATTEVAALREALNHGRSTIGPTTDIHAVCDVVKYWLRNLPEAVFPESFYHRIIDATSAPILDDRLSQIREVVQVLPRAQFYLLQRLVEHFEKVSDYEEKNHMSVQNLAITISPNLVRAPHDNFAVIMKNMGNTHMLFKALLMHSHTIFDEGDGDPDNEEDEEDEGSDPDPEHPAEFSTIEEEADDTAVLSPDPMSPDGGDEPWPESTSHIS